MSTTPPDHLLRDDRKNPSDYQNCGEDPSTAARVISLVQTSKSATI